MNRQPNVPTRNIQMRNIMQQQLTVSQSISPQMPIPHGMQTQPMRNPTLPQQPANLEGNRIMNTNGIDEFIWEITSELLTAIRSRRRQSYDSRNQSSVNYYKSPVFHTNDGLKWYISLSVCLVGADQPRSALNTANVDEQNIVFGVCLINDSIPSTNDYIGINCSFVVEELDKSFYCGHYFSESSPHSKQSQQEIESTVFNNVQKLTIKINLQRTITINCGDKNDQILKWKVNDLLTKLKRAEDQYIFISPAYVRNDGVFYLEIVGFTPTDRMQMMNRVKHVPVVVVQLQCIDDNISYINRKPICVAIECKELSYNEVVSNYPLHIYSHKNEIPDTHRYYSKRSIKQHELKHVATLTIECHIEVQGINWHIKYEELKKKEIEFISNGLQWKMESNDKGILLKLLQFPSSILSLTVNVVMNINYGNYHGTVPHNALFTYYKNQNKNIGNLILFDEHRRRSICNQRGRGS
eukprot:146053_1